MTLKLHDFDLFAQNLDNLKPFLLRLFTITIHEFNDENAIYIFPSQGMEKVKNRMNEEVEDLLLDLERAQAQANSMEKKQKKVDAQINEWKQKCADLQGEVDKAQKDSRVASSEVLKIRANFQGKGTVKIYRVYRLGFGKVSLNSSPPPIFLVEKRSSSDIFYRQLTC